MITAVFFDFGGVIAEEGWENGLNDIASFHGFDPQLFFDDARDVLWNTGYMYGRAMENVFWTTLAKRYEFKMSYHQMREKIFERFKIRPKVIELIERIGNAGYRLAILSDQTNWLDELNAEHSFYHLFEKVYNSYYLGKGKKDITVFAEVCDGFGVKPEEVLFVDDNAGHIKRASDSGLQVCHFDNVEEKIKEIEQLLKL
ncbi:MAG: HAD family phosphatase [Denitrovibrio sp.]|nr:MAG: HAD family phosphatase [Denitrovibrio sp.]